MKRLTWSVLIMVFFSCGKADEPYFNRYFLTNTLSDPVKITFYADSSYVDTAFVLAPGGTFEERSKYGYDGFCEPPFRFHRFAELSFNDGKTKRDTQCLQYYDFPADETSYMKCAKDHVNIFNLERYRDTVLATETKMNKKKDHPCRQVYYIGPDDLAEAK